jgi:CHAD domain-containing protein
MVQFVDKQQAKKSLSLSGETLKRYRLQGEWIEGIHWVRINSRCVRYNLELIQDWFHNRHDPSAHMRAIEFYQDSLLSNQKKSTRKKS